jgi:hypothetical protein
LNLVAPRDIPSFELAYAGSPRALEPSTEAQSLRSYLSMRMLQDSVQQLEELQQQERELIEAEKQFQREQEERERQRRAERQREADMQLDRKQRELAARLKAQKDEGEQDEGEQDEGEENAADKAEAEGPAGDAESSSEAAPEQELRSDTVTVSPLDVPSLDENAIGALIEQQAVPMPRLKPEQTGAAAVDSSTSVLKVPNDGNLGRIPEPVFSGPTMLQPNLGQPHPEMGRR